MCVAFDESEAKMKKAKSTPPVVLPTGKFDTWTVTSLRDSFIDELAKDRVSITLQMFFYAITYAGWAEVQRSVSQWVKAKTGRCVTVFVGTDHAITDPSVIEVMHRQGINVRLMNSYSGVFHPKVIWMSGKSRNLVWVGSNNLTKDGLLNNIEFAVLIKSHTVPADLNLWAKSVEAGSSEITDELIDSYKEERELFERNRAAAKSTTFTWSRRGGPKSETKKTAQSGDLIVEIMPEETRGGNQIQFPKAAVKSFFGLDMPGDQTTINLQRKGSKDVRQLVITVFSNNTVRLSVNELEYRDRPCVIVFHRARGGRVVFEIVSESIFPSRYRALISTCTHQTRQGSRRWNIL
ncbi:hypothetical protein GALL_117640 [mine drainage metagenome]|uniref:Phospholipase D-like domain-containing protein n=1 Tax=mine drainage metagenome TaxID=410659 RepID=A0A1J5SC82_9ZZZZ